MSKYKWVRAPDSSTLISVGINDDGSLHNPNGYPEDVVRAAVLAADARRHERRSKAAKKGADTRRRRHEHRVAAAAKSIAGGLGIGPLTRCWICGRSLDDPTSVKRGIGPECWEGVLATIDAYRARGAAE